MKEQFEYLIDTYIVRLIVNRDYKDKNNLYSLSLVADKLDKSYIIPCDVWCEDNPFSSNETESWYMVTNKLTTKSKIKADDKSVLHRIAEAEKGNREIGIAYLTAEASGIIRNNIASLLKLDSSAYTAACYSYKKLGEDEKPSVMITLLWCLLLVVLPIALVFSESSMNNIQSVSIISAFPIGIIMILMIWSFFKDAKKYIGQQAKTKNQ